MHAAEALPAVRAVVAHGRPGLIVADDRGGVLSCLSSVHLLKLTLPSCLWDEPNLARVINEEHADQIAAAFATVSIRDVVSEPGEVAPVARPEATVVELAELMVRHSQPVVVVKHERGVVGVVTANRLQKFLVSAAQGDGPR